MKHSDNEYVPDNIETGLVAAIQQPIQSTIESDFTNAPPIASTLMFPGIIGECVTATTASTEAVPVAVAANIIGRFCAMVGRPSKQLPDAPHLYIGDAVIHCRPFFLNVGPTAKGRKGTSDQPAERIFNRVDKLLFERHSLDNPGEHKSLPEQYWPLSTHGGGLSTGEGISYFLRDNVEDKQGEIVAGQPDKRLFVVEEEFANVMAVCRRESNILSGTIRKLWDGKTLSPLTKNDRYTATDPHVCINGHITAHELLSKSTDNDVANGFLNRFMILFCKRQKLVALPKRTDENIINTLAEKISDAVSYAQTAGELKYSDCFERKWEDEYKRLTLWDGGRVMDSLFARSETYVLMLSAIFCLLDKRAVITEVDLDSALAWVSYCQRSLMYIYDGERRSVEAEIESEFAETVYNIIASVNNGNGCTCTDINRKLGNQKNAKNISNALDRLLNTTPPRIFLEDAPSGPRGGRRKKIYWPSQEPQKRKNSQTVTALGL